MYFHIGNNVVIKKSDIIGIFDIDKTTTSAITKKFLSDSDRSGRVTSVGDKIPRSFTLTRNGKIYLSQISPTSLTARAGKNGI